MGNELSLTSPNFSVELKDKVYSIAQIPSQSMDVKQFNGGILALGIGSELIQLYDVSKQALIKEFEGCGFSKLDKIQVPASFSPDGKQIAYRWHEKVRIRQMDNLDFVKEIKTQEGSSVANMAWSADSQFICIGSTSDKATVYNMKTDQIIGHFDAKCHEGMQLSQHHRIYFNIFPKFSNCGKFLLVRWDNFVKVYRVEETECKLDIELKHQGDIASISFSPDGKLVAVGSGSENFKIWDFQNRSTLAEIKGSPKSETSQCICNPAWSGDGKYFVCRWYKEAYIYETSSWKIADKFKIGDNVAFLKFSPDSQLLAVGGKQCLTIWDVNSKQVIKAMECSTYDQWEYIEIQAAWTSNSQIAGRWEKCLRVWNM